MYRSFALFLSILLVTGSSFAQRDQKPGLDASELGVVYRVPAMAKVSISRDIVYRADEKRTLTIDVYRPPGVSTARKLPVVVFMNGIGDTQDRKSQDTPAATSYPRLVAAHGLVAVTMQSDRERLQESFREVFRFLAANEVKFGIDTSRIGVYAASANTTEAGKFLNGPDAPRGIRAAAFYYGVPPPGKLREDLPMFFILADGDSSGFFGQQSASIWQRTMEAHAPWTIMFARGLNHAFDYLSDTAQARNIVRQTIDFWKFHLENRTQPELDGAEERKIFDAAFYGKSPQVTADLLAKWIGKHPTDSHAYTLYGNALTQLKRTDDAATALEKALELGGPKEGLYFNLGRLRREQKRYEDAIASYRKALELGGPNGVVSLNMAFVQIDADKLADSLSSLETALQGGVNKSVVLYTMASVYVKLKQIDNAFAALNRSIDEGFKNKNGLATDPALELLRSDPRFQQVLNRLN